MELVGEVAEEYEIDKVKSLTKLVKDFTDEKAILGKKVFSEVDANIKRGVTGKQNRLRDGIQNMINDVPLPFQEEDMKEALDSMVADYICLEMGLRYDRLSSDLFKLQRRIDRTVGDRYNSKDVDLAIPLFACVEFGKSVWELEKACTLGGDEYNVSIKARVPPITRKVKEKAKQVTADYLEICSKALRQKGISDVLLPKIDTMSSLDLSIAWIPSLSEMDIELEKIIKDPILVANIYDRHYLIHAWDIQGEEPYLHYIKEFTEKNAKK